MCVNFLKMGYYVKPKPFSPFDFVKRTLFWLYRTFIWPVFKWFRHVVTNASEIERIMKDQSTKSWAKRVLRFERALLASKSPDLRHLPMCPVQAHDDVITTIARQKAISKRDLARIHRPLSACVRSLLGYNALVLAVERDRQIQYDSTNPDHERRLMHLWSLVQPDEPLQSRVTKQWQTIGFQGNDPATDFRGMGLLGLDQLIFLFTRYTDCAHQLYSTSLHPQVGFPFCIAGIAITSLTRDLLRHGHLKAHMFNTVTHEPTMDDFHKAYVQIFRFFIIVWKQSDVKSVMEFDEKKDKFAIDVMKFLCDENSQLPIINTSVW